MSDDAPVRLREYIEAILNERKEQVAETRRVLERRLEGLNDLREEVNRDRLQYVTKENFYREHQALVLQVEKLTSAHSRLVGMGIVLTVSFGLLGTLLGWMLKH